MRTKTLDTSIKVTKATRDRLIADRDEFQKTIGGGKWSVDDTINELYKIINGKMAVIERYEERLGFKEKGDYEKADINLLCMDCRSVYSSMQFGSTPARCRDCQSKKKGDDEQ